ncbi:HAMP domain-containing sensor histidine kinase [Pseudonocardia sp. MH-G8]|uniref:HAMP domain-containing sensor histidine kinase n=1 Tax=Pseudonocardia sp. MH-G8 TaxID=1854588 RepID=UPI001E44DA7F|nr:HAMP domain-containing sensor histidine kinase [Pseudonocardia sp. MH-G8]
MRLTLRWRIGTAFGLAWLLLTGVLAAATWNLAAGYMLGQREMSAVRQAEVNIRLVDDSLRSGAEGLDELLTGLTSDSDSTVFLSRPQGWITSGRRVDPASLPDPLLALARSGVPDTRRLTVEHIPVIAVALPAGSGPDVFVELFPLVELERTLRFLGIVLVCGVAGGGLLGFALGAWASKRALRPLTELTGAASRMASGDLRTRLPEHTDRDLAALASAFNDTAEALEARVLRDARFAGDVSHELRSPLTTMANAAAVLRRRRSELAGTAGRALDLLLSEVDRFERMVVDLLEISRDDQDSDDPSGEVVNLGELLRNVLDVRAQAPPVVEIEDRPLLVQGDRRRLDRIVANLLDNADRYAGGAVRVAVRRRDGRARLEVDDAGPGVPEELRERVFERFARGVQAGQRGPGGGSGLGLALVAQHVRHHRGAVWIEDRPAGGARFVVELPEADH